MDKEMEALNKVHSIIKGLPYDSSVWVLEALQEKLVNEKQREIRTKGEVN